MTFSYRFIGFLLFISAFLLFLIQPLVSKLLLPVMGGTPAVWTTSMLFFQALLLGGYCWAHIMIRYLPLYGPPVIQVALTALGLYVINFSINMQPDFTTGSPVMWQLQTMFGIVGLPYFILATNAPLYQALYKNFIDQTQSAKTPYALYSLSNIGSFLALIAYPFAIEPLMTLETQSSFWHYGYGFLCLLVACSAMLFFRLYLTNRDALKKRHDKSRADSGPHPYTLKNISFWLLLAFIPSSLMMGVTSHITTDIASVPLLWVIPLAFYLASFIIAFAEPPLWWAKRDNLSYLLAYMSALSALFLTLFSNLIHNVAEISLHYGGFLFIATYCHLLLSKYKPDPQFLTGFFIFVSLGGVLGGIFNALVAYQIFNSLIEYPLILSVFLLLIFLNKTDGWKIFRRDTLVALGVLAFCIGVIIVCVAYPMFTVITLGSLLLIVGMFCNVKKVTFCIMTFLILLVGFANFRHDSLLKERNIFGVLTITDDEETSVRSFRHGTTLHGLQPLPLSDAPTPTSYFHPDGPLGSIFEYLDQKNPDQDQNIAVLGMGTGATGCYTRNNRRYSFYEIDKDVIRIATDPQYFTYLSACQPNANILLGDARIKLGQQPDQSYDAIILDIFSSDSIPVHFLTKEAFAIYAEKIKDGGLVVFHISNRYFDLKHVVANIANSYGFTVAIKEGEDKEDDPIYQSAVYMIATQSPTTIENMTDISDGWKTEGLIKPDQALWTDSYANIFQVLRF